MRLHSLHEAVCPLGDFALLLVLGLTAFDLYRPMLVGDAIDTFGANGGL